jgi:hypothetical protein
MEAAPARPSFFIAGHKRVAKDSVTNSLSADFPQRALLSIQRSLQVLECRWIPARVPTNRLQRERPRPRHQAVGANECGMRTHHDRTDGPDNFFRSFFVPGVPAWSGTAPKTRHRTPSMRWDTTVIAEKELAASGSVTADCELARQRMGLAGRTSWARRSAPWLCETSGPAAGAGWRCQGARGMVLCVRASHGPRWTAFADGSTERARLTAGSLRRSPDTRSDIPVTDGRHRGKGAVGCARELQRLNVSTACA